MLKVKMIEFNNNNDDRSTYARIDYTKDFYFIDSYFLSAKEFKLYMKAKC